MSPNPAPTLAVLIDRIARELAREAEAVRGLHALVKGGDGSPATVRLAQTIDTTPQHLDEIAALLARLSSILPDAGLPNAGLPGGMLASGIQLSALRERLFGGDDAGASDAGELDMF
ncbi:hypothetical protein [Aureimonas sp. AU12]|uniref:hypothetical protein n=1 Tax=Aureimonas sp. AU12 TaxID=1638161 RepID=UPI0007859576|nr:hypothetical protein [Aureimonas sp. AU12]